MGRKRFHPAQHAGGSTMTMDQPELLSLQLGDARRLAALQRLQLLDSVGEESLDRLTRLASTLLAAPGTLVNIIDAERQLIKSCLGLPEPWSARRELPLHYGLCVYVVASEAPLIVEDIREQELYADNPAVLEFGLRSYAGMPLRSKDDQVIGTFCVFDTRPRAWSERELQVLEDLAAAVMTEIELQALAYESQRRTREAELARVEAELAVRLRDQVLACVSHDLKNPLAAIKGQAQLILRRVRRAGDAPALQATAKPAVQIEAAANKMLDMIEELSDIARLQLGQPLDLQCKPCDLLALTERAIDDVRQLRGCSILLASSESELVGTWDERRLRRVVDNLLDNAVKYSTEQQVIHVTITQEPGWAVLDMVDHGVGVPAADLESIFEPFRRGGNVKDRVVGMGLGLTSVRQIVEQHGGTISVESQEGSGTTVRVRMPLESAAP